LKGIGAMRNSILLALSVFGYSLSNDSTKIYKIDLSTIGMQLPINKAIDNGGNTKLHSIALSEDFDNAYIEYGQTKYEGLFDDALSGCRCVPLESPFILNNKGQKARDIMHERSLGSRMQICTWNDFFYEDLIILEVRYLGALKTILAYYGFSLEEKIEELYNANVIYLEKRSLLQANITFTLAINDHILQTYTLDTIIKYVLLVVDPEREEFRITIDLPVY